LWPQLAVAVTIALDAFACLNVNFIQNILSTTCVYQHSPIASHTHTKLKLKRKRLCFSSSKFQSTLHKSRKNEWQQVLLAGCWLADRGRSSLITKIRSVPISYLHGTLKSIIAGMLLLQLFFWSTKRRAISPLGTISLLVVAVVVVVVAVPHGHNDWISQQSSKGSKETNHFDIQSSPETVLCFI